MNTKSAADLSFASSEDDRLFAVPSSPPPRKQQQRRLFELSNNNKSPERSVASSAVTAETSFLTSRISQKLAKLLSKVESRSGGTDPKEHMTGCEHHLEGSSPWVSMICLESLERIVTGKEEGSPSCLEEAADSDNQQGGEEHDETTNPILMTNVFLGKSGIVPMLARTMSQSLEAVCQLLQQQQQQPPRNSNLPCAHCLIYWHDRIFILASLIDGACLFNKSNRRGFCEDDPFAFEDKRAKKGIVFYILLLLSQFCGDGGGGVHSDYEKMSGIMLLALRTLTSLTHDNELAAEQMTICNEYGGDDSGDDPQQSIQGLEVLAELVFELEGSGKKKITKNKLKKQRSSNEDLHRYDSTIFCLNTLANIIEAADVRRMLAEITVPSSSCGEILWLKWLCRWLVNQTETFQDAILGIGKEPSASSSAVSSERELHKHEDDLLVAAGNGCVLLACLMTEPEEISEEPESTNTIRNLIIEEMPRDVKGSSTGVAMIINCLKAFCNFYHFSLGDLSVAIITPVKKLIGELEELQKTELVVS
jgi:hypothetical protein